MPVDGDECVVFKHGRFEPALLGHERRLVGGHGVRGEGDVHLRARKASEVKSVRTRLEKSREGRKRTMFAVSSPVGRFESKARGQLRGREEGKERRRIARLTVLVLHDRSTSEHLLQMLPTVDCEVVAVGVDPLLSSEEGAKVERGRDGEEGDPVLGSGPVWETKASQPAIRRRRANGRWRKRCGLTELVLERPRPFSGSGVERRFAKRMQAERVSGVREAKEKRDDELTSRRK